MTFYLLDDNLVAHAEVEAETFDKARELLFPQYGDAFTLSLSPGTHRWTSYTQMFH